MPDRYEERKRIGFITKSERSWCKEFSVIKWGHGTAQMYDIRKWRYGDDGEQCGKGISLTRDELIKLREYIDKALRTSNRTENYDDMPIDLE